MGKGLILITGSGRGLGRDLALVFADNGYDLILNGRNQNNLKEVFEEILSKNVQVSCIPGDIRSLETIAALTEEAKKGKISVLINNAGAPTEIRPFENLSYDEILETIGTNLISPIELTRKIYPLMVSNGGGTIIYINSMIGMECKEQKGIGCAARWGLRGFTGSLRPEAEKCGIKIISVYPTKIKTRPEYVYGYESEDVAKRIYRAHESGFSGILKLDGRPKEFRPKRKIEYG